MNSGASTSTLMVSFSRSISLPMRYCRHPDSKRAAMRALICASSSLGGGKAFLEREQMSGLILDAQPETLLLGQLKRGRLEFPIDPEVRHDALHRGECRGFPLSPMSPCKSHEILQ